LVIEDIFVMISLFVSLELVVELFFLTARGLAKIYFLIGGHQAVVVYHKRAQDLILILLLIGQGEFLPEGLCL